MSEKPSVFARLLGAFRLLLVLPIWLYQRIVSPLIPSRCIYTPTCSEYSRRAILEHGLAGFLLGAARLLRCVGGLYTGGEDPVPERFTFKAIPDGYRKFWRGRDT